MFVFSAAAQLRSERRAFPGEEMKKWHRPISSLVFWWGVRYGVEPCFYARMWKTSERFRVKKGNHEMKTIAMWVSLFAVFLLIKGCVVGEVGPPGGMPSQNGSDTTDGYGAVVQVLHRFERAADVLDHYPNTFEGRHARRLKATGLSSRYEGFFQKVVQSPEFDIDELELQRMQELREALATAAQ